MDWVIPVKAAEPTEELRYALRSIAANAPHDRIWLIGYRPAWVRGVEHIPTRQRGTKYANTTLALRTACEHPDISDPFVYANDDFFIMRPIERVPVLHRGPVRDVEAYYATRANGKYVRGMRETRELMEALGIADPLSYELHVPLPVHKAGMLRALQTGAHLKVLHKRTLYGNLNRIGGTQIRDVKVIHGGGGFPTRGTFLSTMEVSWRGRAGQFIRAKFPLPSRYEASARRSRPRPARGVARW